MKREQKELLVKVVEGIVTLRGEQAIHKNDIVKLIAGFGLSDAEIIEFIDEEGGLAQDAQGFIW